MQADQYCPLIEASELKGLINSEQLLVVDCRFSLADTEQGRSEYLRGHIPGAHYLHLEENLSGNVSAHGGRHPFPALEDFAALSAQLGISQSSRVVAYDSSRFAFASRLWWMLRSVGFEQVQVLNGGYQGWLDEGGETDNSSPEIGKGQALKLDRFNHCLTRDAMLQAVSSGARLVDAREKERYEGLNEPIDPVAGHIPGAINAPWQEVTDLAGRALELRAQKQLWQSIDIDEQIIVYCGSGVTACVDLLSLELAGYSNKKLYMGSWSDWCSYL